MTVIATPAFESLKEARGSTSEHVNRRRVIVAIKFHAGVVLGPHTAFSTLETGTSQKRGPNHIIA
jgi:hypothetical protein